MAVCLPAHRRGQRGAPRGMSISDTAHSMGIDVITGSDGKPRCASADANETACRNDRGHADRLLQDVSIVRNRGKIQATVDKARAMMSASPSLATITKSYEVNRKRAPRSIADLPNFTPQAEAFAKQLKSQGYRFVGPRERVRVHAERRRRQRPRPWLLPRVRPPCLGPELT
jgi:hypothetical protein